MASSGFSGPVSSRELFKAPTRVHLHFIDKFIGYVYMREHYWCRPELNWITRGFAFVELESQSKNTIEWFVLSAYTFVRRI
jgi:hypothetical protein